MLNPTSNIRKIPLVPYIVTNYNHKHLCRWSQSLFLSPVRATLPEIIVCGFAGKNKFIIVPFLRTVAIQIPIQALEQVRRKNQSRDHKPIQLCNR